MPIKVKNEEDFEKPIAKREREREMSKDKGFSELKPRGKTPVDGYTTIHECVNIQLKFHFILKVSRTPISPFHLSISVNILEPIFRFNLKELFLS